MPELRRDPISGRWIIVATERARRPGNIIDPGMPQSKEAPEECAFCRHERKPLYASDGVAVFDSPVLSVANPENLPHRSKGLYNIIEGVGTHEVVVETSEHILNTADLELKQIEHIFKACIERIGVLRKNGAFRHCLVYKNYRQAVEGQSGWHACSHILAVPVIPSMVQERLAEAGKYFTTHQHCLFCDMVAQELKEQKRVIVETQHFVAVVPFAARFLFEVWILPKEHHASFVDGLGDKGEDLARCVKDILQKIEWGMDDPAYDFVIQSAPLRQEEGSGHAPYESSYHWHIEIIPQLTRMAGFEKGTGFYICPIPPEDMAEYLKEVEKL